MAFFERVTAGVKALPGVQGAAYVSIPPFGSIGNTSGFLVEGGTTTERLDALVRVGTVDYLQTIGANLVDGRLLDARDQENAPGVAVINETFARMQWPGRSAVGRRISMGDPEQMRTIVGVVGDVRERGYYPEAKPAVYFANTQVGGTAFLPETLVVRASGELMSLVAPIRSDRRERRSGAAAQQRQNDGGNARPQRRRSTAAGDVARHLCGYRRASVGVRSLCGGSVRRRTAAAGNRCPDGCGREPGLHRRRDRLERSTARSRRSDCRPCRRVGGVPADPGAASRRDAGRPAHLRGRRRRAVVDRAARMRDSGNARGANHPSVLLRGD